MRKIFSILLLALFIFLIVTLIFNPLRLMVLGFFTAFLGPRIVGGLAGISSFILNSIGLLGFAGIMGAIGLVGGVTVHYLWVKADWSLRRWGSQRISQDLGVLPTTSLPSTPIGATTRPAATVPQTVQQETQPEPEPAKEETPAK